MNINYGKFDEFLSYQSVNDYEYHYLIEYT